MMLPLQAASVGNNALYDETANIWLPLLYYFVDVLGMILLLWLLAPGISIFVRRRNRDRYRVKRNEALSNELGGDLWSE